MPPIREMYTDPQQKQELNVPAEWRKTMTRLAKPRKVSLAIIMYQLYFHNARKLYIQRPLAQLIILPIMLALFEAASHKAREQKALEWQCLGETDLLLLKDYHWQNPFEIKGRAISG